MTESNYYFWLKLLDSFYQRREIRKLRASEQAEKNIVIYQEMLLYAKNFDGVISFDEDEEFVEELAITINEPIASVKTTIDLLCKCKLAEWIDDDGKHELYLDDAVVLVGKESKRTAQNKRAYQKRKQREKTVDTELSIEDTEISTQKSEISSFFSTELEKNREDIHLHQHHTDDAVDDSSKKIIYDANVEAAFQWWHDNDVKIKGINRAGINKVLKLVSLEDFKSITETAMNNGAEKFSYIVKVAQSWSSESDAESFSEQKAESIELDEKKVMININSYMSYIHKLILDYMDDYYGDIESNNISYFGNAVALDILTKHRNDFLRACYYNEEDKTYCVDWENYEKVFYEKSQQYLGSLNEQEKIALAKEWSAIDKEVLAH